MSGIYAIALHRDINEGNMKNPNLLVLTPTFRFITALNKTPSGLFSEEDFNSLISISKELKLEANPQWLDILLKKLEGSSNEFCQQFSKIWLTIIENNPTINSAHKDGIRIVKCIVT